MTNVNYFLKTLPHAPQSEGLLLSLLQNSKYIAKMEPFWNQNTSNKNIVLDIGKKITGFSIKNKDIYIENGPGSEKS